MTLEKFSTIMDTFGIPSAYRAFDVPQELPFLVYQRESNDDFHANNSRYHKLTNVAVELYFDVVNEDLENQIEQAFENNGLPYGREYEEYISSEKMYVVRWTVQI